jgi:hypothetical protein
MSVKVDCRVAILKFILSILDHHAYFKLMLALLFLDSLKLRFYADFPYEERFLHRRPKNCQITIFSLFLNKLNWLTTITKVFWLLNFISLSRRKWFYYLEFAHFFVKSSSVRVLLDSLTKCSFKLSFLWISVDRWAFLAFLFFIILLFLSFFILVFIFLLEKCRSFKYVFSSRTKQTSCCSTVIAK